MSDGQERSFKAQRSNGSGAVTSLASQALSVLASRRSARDVRIRTRAIEQLEAAVLDRNPGRRLAVLAEIRGFGYSDAEITEDIVPEVARRLGEGWCSDNVGFADVTIGSARLQAMVRDLGSPEPDAQARGRIAVVVREDETHTLGAMVVTHQLRRYGFSVTLMLCKDDAAVFATVADAQFDAILISTGHREKLAMVGECIKKIRQIVGREVPIVVGGSIFTLGGDVRGLKDADHITTDVFEALTECGLTTSDPEEHTQATTELRRIVTP